MLSIKEMMEANRISRRILQAMGPDACRESVSMIQDTERVGVLVKATGTKLRMQGDDPARAGDALEAVASMLRASWPGIERTSDTAAVEWGRRRPTDGTGAVQAGEVPGAGGSGAAGSGSGQQDQSRSAGGGESDEDPEDGPGTGKDRDGPDQSSKKEKEEGGGSGRRDDDREDAPEETPDETPEEDLGSDVLEDLVELLRMGYDVALVGPAGCGKTTMMRKGAERLGREWTITTAPQMPYDLTGFTDGHGRYVEAAYSDAFMGGKVAGVDEGDRASPEAMIALHAPVANRTMYIRGKGQIDAPEGFQTVMTMNTWGLGQDSEYVTANQLDEATRDRFVFLRVDFDPAIDSAMAGGDAELLDFVRSWRRSVAESRIPHAVLSYRGVERLRVLAANRRFGHVRALEIALAKGLPVHTLDTIRSGMNGGGRWLTALDRLIEMERSRT